MNSNQSEEMPFNRKLNWGVVGASGFVGSGIIKALKEAVTGEIRIVKSPRLRIDLPMASATRALQTLVNDQFISEKIDELSVSFRGLHVVVNAAGLAAPDSPDSETLYGANALLPVVIAEAAQRAGVRKLLHISSVAVQGNKGILDETSFVAPFSPYSRSKALGEQAIANWKNRQEHRGTGQLQTVVIRATSVQGAGRETTRNLQRIAASKLSSVAKPGDQPSVVSSLTGLADFIVVIGSSTRTCPPILIQPWEGATVRTVMQLAGSGRNPAMIPGRIARAGLSLFKSLGFLHSSFKGLARRLEVMWFGQSQVQGWAVDSGLVAKVPFPETLCNAIKPSSYINK